METQINILESQLQHYPQLKAHLQNLLCKIALDQPQHIYDNFEDISQSVRKHQDNKSNVGTDIEQIKKADESVMNLIQPPQTSNDEEPQQESGPVNYVPNLIENADFLSDQNGLELHYPRMIFISCKRKWWYIIKQSKKLSRQKQAKQLRFWGKILGQQNDYYVVQGIDLEGGEQEFPPEVELKGQPGANQYTYWVLTTFGKDWQELPAVTPNQLKTSRQIKYLFSGNLNKKIVSNPHFEGTEAHLVFRFIKQAQMLNSQDKYVHQYYSKSEDERKLLINAQAREIEPVEEENVTNNLDLTKLQNWVHFEPNILLEGRITHTKPEHLEEDVDEEKLMQRLISADPFEPRLKPISDDMAPTGLGKAWQLRIYGDPIFYKSVANPKAYECNQIISIQNLHWPGSFSVYSNSKSCSIYVGQGIKMSHECYYPFVPDEILDEQPEMIDQPEPHAKPIQQKQTDVEED